MKRKNFILNKKYGSVSKDFILNILASGIMTMSTQFLVYPFLSRIISSEEYGIVLILMGLSNAIAVALGNPLNNTRLLLQDEYLNVEENGDFNYIFSRGILVNIIFVSIFSRLIIGSWDIYTLFAVIISLLTMFRAYFIVSYRLTIDYKKNVFASLCGLVGYVVGIGLAYITGLWGFIFILGELFSCMYIFITSKNLFLEKPRKTILYKTTINKYYMIMSGAILSTLMTYMDRFFIFPILGAEIVTQYNVSSLLGKTASILLTPISGVLLTYYVKEKEIKLSTFVKRFLFFSLVISVFYLFIIFFGHEITYFLYPSLYASAADYIYLASLGSAIAILANTIQPTLLRYCDTRWQPVTQVVYITTYLILGLVLMNKYGLLGFCLAIIIANSVKLILMIIIVIHTLK